MRDTRRCRLAIGFVASLALWAGPALAQTPLKPSELVGTYQVTGGEREGTNVPPERLEGTTVRFTEETIVLTPRDRQQTYTATYKLSRADKPGMTRIQMTSRVAGDEKQEVKGLIAKDKDGTLRLIYALAGGEDPTEFRTRGQQHLFVMKPAAAAEPGDGSTEP
jgi:uncharacterized protein (TIGR03067 family)